MSYNASNYTEQGGARTVIGGSLDVVSGGDLDIESGGSLKLAGTAVTATAAEINAIAGGGLSAAELGVLDGVTAGTVTASKALVVSSDKDIASLRRITVTGYVADAVATAANAVSSTAGSTSFTAVPNGGVTFLSCTGSTATSLCGFRLAAPVAGVEKTIVASAGIDATHDAIVETNASGVTIGYAATNHRMAFDAVDEAVVLRGISATKWVVVSNEGTVALSTNFTT